MSRGAVTHHWRSAALRDAALAATLLRTAQRRSVVYVVEYMYMPCGLRIHAEYGWRFFIRPNTCTQLNTLKATLSFLALQSTAVTVRWWRGGRAVVAR